MRERIAKLMMLIDTLPTDVPATCHYDVADQILSLLIEEIKKEPLTDEEIDTAYVDGWASRNAEVDDLLELKAVDGDEEIDVLRELAQAQIQKIIKRMEEK